MPFASRCSSSASIHAFERFVALSDEIVLRREGYIKRMVGNFYHAPRRSCENCLHGPQLPRARRPLWNLPPYFIHRVRFPALRPIYSVSLTAITVHTSIANESDGIA